MEPSATARDHATTAAPLDRKSTSFPAALGERLKHLRREYEELLKSGTSRTAAALRYTQYVVRAFYADPGFGLRPPNDAPAGSGGGAGRPRGLLLDHEMGQGKTRAAAAIAEAARTIPTRSGKPREVVVLLTKSLQANFENEYDAYLELAGETPAERPVRYITSNAHNTAAQMARAARSAPRRKPAAGTGAGTADPYGDIAAAGARALEGTVLVVEEAHNFFRAVLNQGKNAVALYEMMAGATDLYLVFLSGTVPSKDPFELAVCFNLLAGEEVLPSEYNAFRDAFVAPATGASPAGVRNLGKYQNRILGLVSHVRRALPLPGASAGARNPKHEFPERRATAIERLPMGPAQYRAYISARAREDMAAAPRGGPGGKKEASLAPLAPLSKPSRTAGSTYHVESRQLSNFAPPVGFRGTPAELPDSALTPAASPKMARIVEIAVGAKRPVLVYSQFTGIGGLGTLARYLEKAGFSRWEPPAIRRVSGGSAKSGAKAAKAAKSGAKAAKSAATSRTVITRVSPDDLETWMGQNEERRASLIGRGAGPEQAAAEAPGAPTESQEAAPLMHWFVWAADTPGGLANTYVGHLVVARGPPPDVPSELQEAADVGVWLAWVHVVGAARRQGVARRLAERAVEWAAEHAGPLRAAVPASNTAGGAFLRSIGGTRVAEAAGWELYYDVGVGGGNVRGRGPKKAGARRAGARRLAAIKSAAAATKPLARLPRGRRLHYAVHSGDVDIEERAAVEDAFRAVSNAHGADIMVLLLSKTGAEGLNLRYAEEAIAMEPYWDDARLEQFYARVIRPGSHAALPPGERWVQPRALIAAPNPAMAADPPPLTTDEELYRRSARDREIVDAFRAANRGASIEAVAFGYPDARLCAPTGAPLYTETTGADLRAPDPCQPLVRREAKLAELAVDGARIPYRADPASPFGWRFYRFDADAGAHVPIPDNDPMIEELLALVPATGGAADIWGEPAGADGAPDSAADTVEGGNVESRARLPHRRRPAAWKTTNMANYLNRAERYAAMTADQIDALDWGPVNAFLADAMNSRYETAGLIDRVRGKMHVVSAHRGEVNESGEGVSRSADVPGMFYYHTHPHALLDAEKLHLSTRHVLPFMHPSAPDLLVSIRVAADPRPVPWMMLEAPEGRYFWRPGPRITNSAMYRFVADELADEADAPDEPGYDVAKAEERWDRFQERVWEKVYGVRNRASFTLHDVHEAIRKLGFTLYFFPDPGYARRFPIRSFRWVGTTIFRPEKRN